MFYTFTIYTYTHIYLPHTLPSLSVEESRLVFLFSLWQSALLALLHWKTAVRSPCTLFLTHVHTHTLPCSCMSSRHSKCHGNRTAATVTAGSFSYWWGGRLPGRPALLLLLLLARLSSPVSPWNFNDLLSLLLIFLLFALTALSVCECVCVCVCLCVHVVSLSFSIQTDTHQVSTVNTRREQRQCHFEDIRIFKGHVFLYLWKTSSDLLVLASSGWLLFWLLKDTWVFEDSSSFT